MNRLAVGIAIAVAAAAAVFVLWPAKVEQELAGGVIVPELSPDASTGEALFAANCAQCHGQAASGSDKGPPLIHRIYEPGHHGDGSFLLAVLRGTRAHHWDFGDMPPVKGLTDADVAQIVTYVREVQRANGIE